MKKQTNQQQKTQGKTTKGSHNKDKQQTNNKQLLSPKAGILVHTRRICTKIPTKSKAETLTRRRPLNISTKQKELIINTLIYLKNNGKAENTIKSVNQNLTRISKHIDLTKPEVSLSTLKFSGEVVINQ